MKATPYYAQVAYSFVNLSVVNFTAFGRNVVIMTGAAGPVFTGATPTLAELTTQLDKLEAATQLAMNGDRLAIAQRNAEFDQTIAMMRQLGAFVQVKCNGDLPTLLSSGFKARTPAGGRVGQLPAPASVSLSLTGNSGEVLVKWPRLAKAATCTVYVATDADGPYTPQPACTASRYTLTALTPLKPIYVKVCGNGSAGEGVLSSVATIIVL